MYLAICRVFNFFRLFKIVVVYLAIFVVYLAKPFVWFIRMFHELAIARLLYRDNEVVYVNRILTISQPKIINYLKPSSNNVTQQLTVTRRLTITTIIENGQSVIAQVLCHAKLWAKGNNNARTYWVYEVRIHCLSMDGSNEKIWLAFFTYLWKNAIAKFR